MALWSAVCRSPASLCWRTMKCHWHQREIRGSPAQTPWVCGAEEEESCLCHHCTNLWRRTQTHTISQYNDNTTTAGGEPRFNASSETYLSCDQQSWMKPLLPPRCPEKNTRHIQPSNRARRFHHNLFECKFQRRKILAFTTKQMAHEDNEKKSQLECLSKTSWSHLHLYRELGRSAGSTSRGEERFGETGGAEGQGSPESGVTFKMWFGQNKHKSMIGKSDWRGFLSSPRATLDSDATSECFSHWLSLTHRHVRFL